MSFTHPKLKSHFRGREKLFKHMIDIVIQLLPNNCEDTILKFIYSLTIGF